MKQARRGPQGPPRAFLYLVQVWRYDARMHSSFLSRYLRTSPRIITDPAQSEQKKEAGLGKAVGSFALKHGMKPSFKDMLRIRRGTEVVKFKPGVTPKFKGAPSEDPGKFGAFDKSIDRVSIGSELVGREARQMLRHEMRHAYQYGGGGAMKRMTDWRQGSRPFRAALGQSAMEMQAYSAGYKSIPKGLLQWAEVAPKYVGDAKGLAKIPYYAPPVALYGGLLGTGGTLSYKAWQQQKANNLRKSGGALPGLRKVKEHSDKRQYGVKHMMLRKMMTDSPGDWAVDSDDGKGVLGVTHKPTGFQFHIPRSKMAPSV